MPNQIQDLFGKWIQFDCPTDGAAFSIAVANRVWDPGTLTWVSETQPGGGGGGGPATIADGADVAEGATTDAAIVTDVNGTVSGKLRGLVKIFASVWDSPNGRLKVDGSGVTQPVSGSVSVIKLALAANAPSSSSVGIVSGLVLAANASRKGGAFINNSANIISLGFGSAAILHAGVTLVPYGSFEMDEYTFSTQDVYAIASGAASTLGIQEWQ